MSNSQLLFPNVRDGQCVKLDINRSVCDHKQDRMVCKIFCQHCINIFSNVQCTAVHNYIFGFDTPIYTTVVCTDVSARLFYTTYRVCTFL